MISKLIHFNVVLCLLVVLTACATPSTPKPEGIVVTFRVADNEEYKIRLTDPADIEIARKLLAGEEAPRIPNGTVVRGEPDVNTGYTWHIDPAALEFADFTMEVCDGLPSDVEQGLITSEQYCPWSAVVVSIEEQGSRVRNPSGPHQI
jgi:hypothetical protein